MRYTEDEIRQYVIEEDVKFLRLAFCDVYGKQKNISIQPDELERAFEYGIAFDASAVPGFGDPLRSVFAAGHGHALRAAMAARSWARGADVLQHLASGWDAVCIRHAARPAKRSGCGGGARHFVFVRLGDGILSVPAGRERRSDPRPLRPRRLYGHCAGGQGREHPAGDLPDAQPDGDSPGMFAPRTGSGAE